MALNHCDVLKKIPHDQLLRGFLERFSFFPSEDILFDGKINNRMGRKLADEINAYQDTGVRHKIIASLNEVALFDKLSAEQPLLDASRQMDNADLAEYEQCVGTLHKALWLHETNYQKFERAIQQLELVKFAYLCHHMQFGAGHQIVLTEETRNAFKQEIQEFYRKERGSGDAIELDTWTYTMSTTGQNLFCVAAKVKDVAQTSLEFRGNDLHTHVYNPCRPIAIQYAPSTGVTDMLINGGPGYVDMLKSAFSRHLLGMEIKPEALPNLHLNLEALREGFHSAKAYADGFSSLQIKGAVIGSTDGLLRMELGARGKNNTASVTDFELPEQHQTLLIQLSNWNILEIDLKLYYSKGAKFLGKYSTLSFSIRKNGTISWSTISPEAKGRLEEYLIEAGVIAKPTEDAYGL